MLFCVLLLVGDRRRCFGELSHIYGPLTVLTTASATGSLALARKAQDKHRLSYSDDVRGLPEET